jgi:bifunctional aspartokinase / homoserine dehydrogenase 1
MMNRRQVKRIAIFPWIGTVIWVRVNSMITMKFGGTSVGNIERLENVVSIIQENLSTHPVVVASAMSGVTDMLLDTATSALQRDDHRVKRIIDELMERHFNIVNSLVKDSELREALILHDKQLFEQLTSLCLGVSLLRELSARSLDAIVSFGELLSCMQIADILKDRGFSAQFIDSRPLIRTDDHFGEASVDFDHTTENLKNALLPLIQSNVIPVVTGFIGSTEDGITTTLGRSGSDYTASLVGAALGSDEIWIWTDVDGVMTADPRYVNGAISLPEISYREAAEMSYFGAKVIHPKTMMPAIEKSIPIRIKNTFNPLHSGTLISAAPEVNSRVVKNVTSINNLGLVAVEGSGMVGVPGIAARIFSTLARVRVNVMMISQASSEHNVCLILPSDDCRKAVRELRREFAGEIEKKIIDDVKLQEGVSIVAVVGDGMRGVPGIAGRTFAAVAGVGVNIIAIAQGSSELNISLVVDQADIHRTVQAIHDAFNMDLS